jgi:hypothetical protein
MSTATAMQMIFAGGCWRALGVKSAARTLLKGLSSADTDTTTIAAMMLVKAGQRSVPVLLQQIESGATVPLAVSALASIDPKKHVPLFERLAQDSSNTVAQAARDALSLAVYEEERKQ